MSCLTAVARDQTETTFRVVVPDTVSIEDFLWRFQEEHGRLSFRKQKHPLREAGRRQQFVRFKISNQLIPQIEEVFEHWEDFLDANGFC